MSAPALSLRDEQEECFPAALTAQLLLRRTGNWTRWLSRHWDEITVQDGVCSLETIAGRPRLHAQLCVTLGHILPADVRIELLPAAPLTGEHPLARGRAMFSVAVQHGGRYWFAVNAAADPEDDQREWIVRISPSRAEAATQVAPIVRALDLVPDAKQRRRVRCTPA